MKQKSSRGVGSRVFDAVYFVVFFFAVAAVVLAVRPTLAALGLCGIAIGALSAMLFTTAALVWAVTADSDALFDLRSEHDEVEEACHAITKALGSGIGSSVLVLLGGCTCCVLSGGSDYATHVSFWSGFATLLFFDWRKLLLHALRIASSIKGCEIK